MARKRIPYIKPADVFITEEEYREIISKLDSESCKERCEYLYTLLENDEYVYGFQIENGFYSRWGKSKENLAIFKLHVEWWYDKEINNIDWEKVNPKLISDIYALQDMGIDPEQEVFDRWGFTMANRVILEAKKREFNRNKEFDSHTDSHGGFDDEDIIRKIEDGEGDRYGY